MQQSNLIKVFVDETMSEKECITKIIIMGVEVGFMRITPIDGRHPSARPDRPVRILATRGRQASESPGQANDHAPKNK